MITIRFLLTRLHLIRALLPLLTLRKLLGLGDCPVRFQHTSRREAPADAHPDHHFCNYACRMCLKSRVPVRVGAALAGRGDHSRAEQVLRKCEEFLLGLDEATRRARFSDLLGSVYLFQGRNDEALTEWRIAFENGWLSAGQKASREWFIEAPFAKFDPLRDDPRFRALIDDIRADLDRQRRALERDGLAIAE